MPEYSGQVTHVELALVPLWLIVALPFLGAAINALFGRRLQASDWQEGLKKRLHIGSPAVSAVALGVMALAFALTVVNFVQLWGLEAGHRHLYTHGWSMIGIGSLNVSFSFAMDPLGAVMALVVTGVGGLIHVYATSYMADDPSYWRFFCYFNLFIFAMMMLVLGDNFIVMFFGWEGVGLCSYLLIGFWYQDYDKASAGMKAFVVNRVGDFGFICGMALLFWGLGGGWLATTGAFEPDVRPPYIPIHVEALSHAGAHGADAHGAGDHGAGLADQGLADQGDDHGGGAGKHADAHPQLGGMGYLTMTAHAGARVYLGVSTFEDLERLQGIPACRTYVPKGERAPTWNAPQGPQITERCYAEAPFVRKRVKAMLWSVAVAPDSYGATVLGDGAAVGSMKMRIVPDQEMLIAPVGPTLTFREIHDQLVVRTAGAEATIDKPEHGHELKISKEEIQAGQPLLLSIRGTSGHDHKIALSAAVLAKLAAGHSVSLVSGPAGPDRHVHTVELRRPQFLKEALQSKSVWGIALITLACLLFFVGAVGKSAQIPLFVWLPDAMAGPTPVSALIHAATMVTAGVYMVARLNFLFGLTPTASGIVAMVGALTAIFAATIGFFQYDIKKVLAYSTVSQLGFMFIGVGVGAYWAGIFHLVTHAFFKACLFLASGSVIHGMHAVEHDSDEAQDMRNMGGLARKMPLTAKTYFISCLAITAAPIPLFAGFWSKDEILWKAFNSHHLGAIPGPLIYVIGLIAALGTSFYMWRSYYLTFVGKHAKKAIKKKVHESPIPMTYVLVVLAFLATVSGVVLGISSHFTGGIGEGVLPKHATFESWLHPSTAHHEAHIGDAGYGWMLGLMVLSVAGAIIAWSLARKRYGAGRAKDWEAQERKLPGFRVFHHKYWVDEIYQATIIRAFMSVRLVLSEMDRWIVDGLVNAVGALTRGAAWISGAIDHYFVDGAVNFVAYGTLAVGQKLRGLQTGRVQNYIYGILGGVAALAIIQYLFG